MSARHIAALLLLIAALAACSSPATPPGEPAASAPASAPVSAPQDDALQQRLNQQQQSAAKNDGERMGYYAFGQAKNLVLALNTPPEPPAEEQPDPNKNARRPGIKNVEQAGPVGKIDQGAVAGIFRSQQSGLQSCYERGLKKNPSLKGKVQLMITIKADGKVGRVGVGSDTLRDSGVTTCMTSRVKTWVFPKPDGGQVTVAKTFVFAPQG